jgi:hypothetical protein
VDRLPSEIPVGATDAEYARWIEDLTVPHRFKGALGRLLAAGMLATPALRRGLRHDDPDVHIGCCVVLDRVAPRWSQSAESPRKVHRTALDCPSRAGDVGRRGERSFEQQVRDGLVRLQAPQRAAYGSTNASIDTCGSCRPRTTRLPSEGATRLRGRRRLVHGPPLGSR